MFDLDEGAVDPGARGLDRRPEVEGLVQFLSPERGRHLQIPGQDLAQAPARLADLSGRGFQLGMRSAAAKRGG